MLRFAILLCSLVAGVLAQPAASFPHKVQVLIITGRDDHDWRGATANMRQYLDSTGIFDVRTTEEFHDAGPASLAPYDAVVLLYNDKNPADCWTERSRQTLLSFVEGGKGLVIYHHTAAGFHDWPEFARLAGGNYYGGAHHAPIHDFTVEFTDRDHPITRGLKKSFLQTQDELYANMQMQPEGTYHVLAAAWDDHSLYQGKSRVPIEGPGRNEPLMWTLQAGSGRVFGTMIGHSAQATQSAGFRVTFVRGVEWVATGRVTIPPPAEMAQ
jgi:type 1 glutamine amidotransferase